MNWLDGFRAERLSTPISVAEQPSVPAAGAGAAVTLQQARPAAVHVWHCRQPLATPASRTTPRAPFAYRTTARHSGSVPQTAAASSKLPNAHQPGIRLPLHSKSLPSIPSATLVAYPGRSGGGWRTGKPAGRGVPGEDVGWDVGGAGRRRDAGWEVKGRGHLAGRATRLDALLPRLPWQLTLPPHPLSSNAANQPHELPVSLTPINITSGPGHTGGAAAASLDHLRREGAACGQLFAFSAAAALQRLKGGEVQKLQTSPPLRSGRSRGSRSRPALERSSTLGSRPLPSRTSAGHGL